MRSSSFSIGVAASSAPISATRPLPKAAWMSATVSARTAKSWWAQSA